MKKILLILFITLLLIGCKSRPSVEVESGDKVDVDLYLMSFCPFGNQAEEIIEPVYDALKDDINFKAHYVLYSNYRGGGPIYCLDKEDKYCSMHGIYELNQGLRELCVANHIGYDAWFEFIKEINKECTYLNADACWEGVAKRLKLDIELIKTCEKEEGLSLAEEELALNELNEVRGSPTLFIAGESYNGPRSAQDYLQGICAKFEKKPDVCSQIIAAPQVSTPSGGCE